VGIESVDPAFVEPGNAQETFGTMLAWLQDYRDPNLGARAALLRDQYGADTVVLVSSATAFCGLAPVNYDYHDIFAFAVYNGGCLYGSMWMHELGHTMGCFHDRTSDSAMSANRPTYLGFGNCWEDASKTDCTCYQSVMATACTTPNGCSSCSGRNYLANYLVSFAGNPTGSAAASCGLHIDNNRLLPIKYRKSKQPGGMIFKVTPNIAVAASCFLVTITGWQLRTSNVGDTIVSVTLDGRITTIVSQTIDSVVVLTPTVSNPSGLAGSVVVTTSSGRSTTLPGAFTFQPSTYSDLTNFQGKSLGIWRNNGIINWSFRTEAFDTSLFFDGDLATTEANAKVELLWTSQVGTTTNPGKCQYTAGGIQFRYWAYEEVTWCYGDFSLSVLSGTTNQWSKIWKGKTNFTGGPTPWQGASLTFPANTVGVKIYADTNPTEYCRWWTPLKLDDISLSLTTTCDRSACGNAAATTSPSLRPTTSFTNIPTPRPTVPVTVAPTMLRTNSPTIVPTVLPTILPTFSPTFFPTIVPTALPTRVPTKIPTRVPTRIPTARPSVVPTTIPTRRPTIVPTAVPSRTPTFAPSVLPTLQPSFNAKQVGQVSCAPYTATQTTNATQNYVPCTIVACPGYTVRATMCEGETVQLATCTGNSYLQVYDGTNTVKIASNDDFCGRCSGISFLATGTTCQKYTIRQGCFGSTSCSGTVGVIFNL
jgi:hypothetical protein